MARPIRPGDDVIVTHHPGCYIPLCATSPVIAGLLGYARELTPDGWVVDFPPFGEVVVPEQCIARARKHPREYDT